MTAPGHDHPKIVVLDFGSQVSMLIARRLREVQVFSEMRPYTAWREVLADPLVAGIVLSGGPASVSDPGAPDVGAELWRGGKPLLGICYGMQLMCHALGGRLAPAANREYGHAELEVLEPDALFAGQPARQPVWMSHGDRVDALPPGFQALARTAEIPYAAAADPARGFYCVQFHPEVAHTRHGLAMIEAFARRACRLEDRWTAAAFVAEAVAEIRDQVGRERVLCAVSGGVDSTVMATLVDRAVGDRLHAVYVDNGVMRLGESDQVQRDLDSFLQRPIQRVDAGAVFLARLAGVTAPERKRKIIGETFIDVFTESTRERGPFGFLAQGTLYPDRIESHSIHGPSSVIKTHHNVGGLPERLGFALVEPLRDLFKDEVRRVGRELGIPASLLGRHPFPGPGLAVRILGEVTAARVSLLQRADHIFIEELRRSGQYDAIWQAGAILLPVQSVGVMGDQRTYENAVALRAVTSLDGMTADWARIPPDLLARVSNRIINEVPGVNRVVYDVSSKPPSTIEWE
ncbi:MAG TPA: glutamine-hydrolyzing GMP synthase [Candidatus Krumholzibacteria bacterium]|nr:glutamine-hydrolyzing GMP synthase [Candidatus Krumholzibacteria bacterium]HPD71595.1 glutamine-hydrolyzing GMP synthase [Candidatus Krumholzibacteria bacterium]HRY41472.1 glutamine-hydrolyzing GMP synthase [Candidatus Krumholzibacteria bacterium]